jgi:hypothetical protein
MLSNDRWHNVQQNLHVSVIININGTVGQSSPRKMSVIVRKEWVPVE